MSPDQSQSYYDIDRFMSDHELLLAYRDDINELTVQYLLTLTEARLSDSVSDKKFRKRVFQILVECLQNVVNHAHHSSGKRRASILLMGRCEKSLTIITGNLVSNAHVARLRERLEHVNQIGHDQVRDLYSEALRDSAFSSKGGAGLGLLDIYKRSGNSIDFDFTPASPDSTFFTMKVMIDFPVTAV